MSRHLLRADRDASLPGLAQFVCGKVLNDWTRQDLPDDEPPAARTMDRFEGFYESRMNASEA